jgi:HD-GYP domain-containing protein (c-di-GMP phosphodiesterase class II)
LYPEESYGVGESVMAVVRIRSGLNKGAQFDVKDEVISLGRDAACTIQIMDQGVSRQHAEIFRIGEMCFIRDLTSTNGTFVNDVKITEELLRPGDQVRIGLTIIGFEDQMAALKEIEKQIEMDDREEEISQGSTTIEMRLDKGAEMQHKIEAIGKEVESRNLTVLCEVAKIIGTEKDLKGLTGRILALAAEAVNADAGYVFLLERGSGKLVQHAKMEKQTGDTKVSRTILKRVLQYSRSILSSDALLDSRFSGSQSIAMRNIKSVICAPLISMDRSNGVLYLHSSKALQAFTSDDLELATAIAIQAGTAIFGFSAAERVKKASMNIVKVLVAATETRDPRSQGHAERVANFATAIAGKMKLAKGDLMHIQMAALLHDVGKIALSAAPVPSEKGKPKDEHVLLAEKLLANMDDVSAMLPMIRHHHEKWDGTGFPDKLKGADIPVGARILAVANVFDHLTTIGGMSGTGLPVKDALMDMGRQGGVEFDDKVVEALLAAHQDGSLFAPASPFEDLVH